ncbi:MAG: hypothetical protein ACKPEN_05245, partial [Planktothrix sp.]|uniref:hypothetical protein n=1 Tax=Planktothrix sp. TaxID=3088171 RepID=UPI0038D44E9C
CLSYRTAFLFHPCSSRNLLSNTFPKPQSILEGKGYDLDADTDSETVAGNWTRDNLARYYYEKS